MPELMAYRVLKKWQAAALIAGVFSVGALSVWVGIGWVDAFSASMKKLVAAHPDTAAATLAAQLRIVAVVNGIVLSALAAFVSWYGVKGFRSKSMPPVGSWIIEGQRIRTGANAVMVSKVMFAAGVLLALLAVASSVFMWDLADYVSGSGSGG